MNTSILSKQSNIGLGLVTSIGLLLSTLSPVYSEWYVEVGPLYRGDMQIEVVGGSHAAHRGLYAAPPGTRGQSPQPQANLLNDDGSAQVYREFDDGFVGPSGWAWAQAEGWSQHFGYDQPAQYDADADTLTYNLTLEGVSASSLRSTTTVAIESTGWSGRERTDGVGLMATIGYQFRKEKDWKLAAQLRAGWLDGIQGDFLNQIAHQQHIDRRVFETTVQHSQQYEYTYATLGNPAFPTAPYDMSNPSGVGPLIEDTPVAVHLVADNNQTTTTLKDYSTEWAVSYVDLDMDAHLFTFQAGPRLQWQVTDGFELLLQPAFTMNLLDATARRHESFQRANGDVIAVWNNRIDKQAWLMGAGIEAGLKFALSAKWSLLASGGYEWVHDYSFYAGPDRVEIDLSGYQVGIALGYTL